MERLYVKNFNEFENPLERAWYPKQLLNYSKALFYYI